MKIYVHKYSRYLSYGLNCSIAYRVLQDYNLTTVSFPYHIATLLLPYSTAIMEGENREYSVIGQTVVGKGWCSC